MEPSLSSLTYKGSITEAIFLAKNQKKLLIVYISGDNDESVKLEESTWKNSTVGEALSKYCVLLHVIEGSTDATNFAAIYPQNSVPCITAIGFNGQQVWQSEGFVNAEVLASSLENAYLSLLYQERTASILAAALASRKAEPSTSVASSPLAAEGSSSDTAIALSSKKEDNDTHQQANMKQDLKSVIPIQSSKEELPASSKEAEKSGCVGPVGEEGSISCIKADNVLVTHLMPDSKSSASDDKSSSVKDCPLTSGVDVAHQPGISVGDSHKIAAKANTELQLEKAEGVIDRNLDSKDTFSSINKPTDVHLNIRLPDGVSLQETFSLTILLGGVKDYVDRNQSSNVGSYDLAIPYPRKVFNDQDLKKSLSELGLLNRQSLIVVPRQGTTFNNKAQSSLARDMNSTNGSDGGYFDFAKRFLSYFNPFSYLGGDADSSTSGPESQTGMRVSGSTLMQRNNFPQADAISRPRSTSTDQSNNRSRPTTTSRYGSNIHTLKHDEDDSKFGDRNAFWNGNSTQYGGGSDNNGR